MPDLTTYFTKNDIAEIVGDLEKERMINFKFTYKTEGAKHWDNFYHQVEQSGGYESNARSKQIISSYLPVLVDRIKNFDEVNIVEIGPGNGLPIVDFLNNLSKKSNLKKYIGVDISEDLLDYAEKNLSELGPGLDFQKVVADLEKDGIKNSIYSFNKKLVNIMLIISGTIYNSIYPKKILSILYDALSVNDILIFTATNSNKEKNLSFSYMQSEDSRNQDTWIPRLMGIDVDNCDLFAEFNAETNEKNEFLILDKDYSLKFDKVGVNKTVNLMKNDKILLWKYSAFDLNDSVKLFEEVGFSVLDAITSPDKKHFLIAVQRSN